MVAQARLPRSARALLALAAVLALAAGGLPGAAAAAPAPSVAAKIDQRLLDATAGGKSAGFFVNLVQRADLAPAARATSRAARKVAVVQRLRATADRTQVGVRGLLTRRKVRHTALWAANSIFVPNGDRALADELSRRADVRSLEADIPIPHADAKPLPAPEATPQQAGGAAWNLAAIGAQDVWSSYDAEGDGIVVATIDSGVSAAHPALAPTYRGNDPGGPAGHDYNWYDATYLCPQDRNGQFTPCDDDGHGTHITGIMAGTGTDNNGERFGIAPGARWIAAKACQPNAGPLPYGCFPSALAIAEQWILAPTDRQGQGERPDLAPDIVNASYGSGQGSTAMQQIIDAWQAAGIFPAFAAGNTGPACRTAESAGDLPAAYSAGAFDRFGNITSFSARGPAFADAGLVKPNIAAPGAGIVSTARTGGFEAKQGTSFAAPHVAGAVALLWSAVPALNGDVGATKELLDRGALDTPEAAGGNICGGTAQRNNTWGEGKLDVFATVTAGKGGMGRLGGKIVAAATNVPAGDAKVTAAGPVTRTATSTGTGDWTLALPPGAYTITAKASGFTDKTATATVADGQVTTVDLRLDSNAPPPPPARKVFLPVAGRAGMDVGIQVSNAATSDAYVDIAWINPDGTTHTTLSRQLVPAGGSKTVFDERPRNFTGSAVITALDGADKVSAVANHVLGGDRISSSGGFASGAQTVLLPLLTKEYFTFTTLFSVQNTGTGDAAVTITYPYDMADPANPSRRVPATETATLKPGAAKVFDQAAAPAPFPGDKPFDKPFSATVTSTGGAVAATVFEVSPSALLEYAGTARERAATSLVAPLVMAGNYGIFTGIQVQNTGSSAASVTVEYGPNTATRIPDGLTKCPDPPAGNRTFTHPEQARPGQSVTLLQRAGNSPDDDPAFAGCVYVGAARVTSSQPVVAIVNQSGPGLSSAYEAIPATEVTGSARLPLVQVSNYGSSGGVQVANAGTAPVSATITFGANGPLAKAPDGTVLPGQTPRCTKVPGARTVSLGVLGTDTSLLLPEGTDFTENGVPCSYVGSVTVTATTPGGQVAVLANQVSAEGPRDRLGTYVGSPG